VGARREKYFCPWGSAQALEKSQNGKGNPRKSKHFPWLLLCRALRNLVLAWLDLALAWKNFEISTWVAQWRPRGFSAFCPRE
jgi:hypothetical protein